MFVFAPPFLHPNSATNPVIICETTLFLAAFTYGFAMWCLQQPDIARLTIDTAFDLDDRTEITPQLKPKVDETVATNSKRMSSLDLNEAPRKAKRTLAI